MFRQWTNTSWFDCSTAHTALTFKGNRINNKCNKQNKWAKQDNERKRSANETNRSTSTCCVSLPNSFNSVNASIHWFQQSDLLFLFNLLLKQKNIIVVGNKWPYKRKICSTAHDEHQEKKPFIFLNFLYNKGLITRIFSNNLALAREYESFAKVLYLVINQHTTKTAL